MRLDNAINRSTNCRDFCEIFSKGVKVQIDTFWGVDSVSVEGYKGTVTTDFIAEKLFGIKLGQKEEASQLHDLLKDKVFIPLRNRVIKLDRSNCTATLTYKVRNWGVTNSEKVSRY